MVSWRNQLTATSGQRDAAAVLAGAAVGGGARRRADGIRAAGRRTIELDVEQRLQRQRCWFLDVDLGTCNRERWMFGSARLLSRADQEARQLARVVGFEVQADLALAARSTRAASPGVAGGAAASRRLPDAPPLPAAPAAPPAPPAPPPRPPALDAPAPPPEPDTPPPLLPAAPPARQHRRHQTPPVPAPPHRAAPAAPASLRLRLRLVPPQRLTRRPPTFPPRRQRPRPASGTPDSDGAQASIDNEKTATQIRRDIDRRSAGRPSAAAHKITARFHLDGNRRTRTFHR